MSPTTIEFSDGRDEIVLTNSRWEDPNGWLNSNWVRDDGEKAVVGSQSPIEYAPTLGGSQSPKYTKTIRNETLERILPKGWKSVTHKSPAPPKRD